MARKTVKKASKTKRVTPASASRSSSAAGSARESTRAAKIAKAKATKKKTVKPKRVAKASAAKKKKTVRPAKTAGRTPKASSKARSTGPKRTGSARRPATAPAAERVAAPRGAIAPPTGRPLTPTETESFRQMLLQKRAEIMSDVSTLQNEALNRNRQDAAGDLSSMPIHMADLGSDNFELEFTLGLIEGERAILKEIDEALERIQEKRYGFCLATGNPIGKARLRATPWAKYCYEYTLAQEKGQGRGL